MKKTERGKKKSPVKQLGWQSIVLAAVLVLICLVSRLRDNTYTSYVPMAAPGAEEQQFRMVERPESSGDDPKPASDVSGSSDRDAEASSDTGRMSFEEPRQGSRYLEIRMQPQRQGDVFAELEDASGNAVSAGYYRIGPFGTVYDYSTGGFTGDNTVMIALTVFFLAESILLLLSFRRAKGPSFYAYSTIHTAGFSLFLLLTGITLLAGTIRHMQEPGSFTMMSVYQTIALAGYHFLLLTLPLILAFAITMTVSNIALLRHERRRFQNVLGILVSILMVTGAALAIYLFSRDFSGSETEYRVWSTVLNVYATVYVYFECMLIGAVICGILAARHIPEGACGYIIILGCGFRKDGSLPPLLRGRVDRAIAFWKEQKEAGVDAVLIPSGGQGSNETMPEAEAMRRYLLQQGIPEESILPEERSANTYQNMEYSKRLIVGQEPEPERSGSKVIFSTTNYHVFRSGVWASLAGLEAEGIGSRTKWWFWPNAFIRECVGLLQNRWKQELLLLLILAALFGVISMII